MFWLGACAGVVALLGANKLAGFIPQQEPSKPQVGRHFAVLQLFPVKGGSRKATWFLADSCPKTTIRAAAENICIKMTNGEKQVAAELEVSGVSLNSSYLACGYFPLLHINS